MPRLTIAQFRAALTGGRHDGAQLRAYREVTRRPELATAMHAVEWAAWPSAVADPARA